MEVYNMVERRVKSNNKTYLVPSQNPRFFANMGLISY